MKHTETSWQMAPKRKIMPSRAAGHIIKQAGCPSIHNSLRRFIITFHDIRLIHICECIDNKENDTKKKSSSTNKSEDMSETEQTRYLNKKSTQQEEWNTKVMKPEMCFPQSVVCCLWINTINHTENRRRCKPDQIDMCMGGTPVQLQCCRYKQPDTKTRRQIKC